MKQMAVCYNCEDLVRVSNAYTVEVNEVDTDTETGKKTVKKFKTFVCKNCAKNAGYKEKKKHAKKEA